jgi:hypothetical protein
MSTARNRALKKALCDAATLPQPRPATAFWQDFRARASLTVQQAPEAATAPGGTLLSLRWASAALVLLLGLGAAALYLHPRLEPVQVAVAPAAPPRPALPPSILSKVEEVEVLSEYSSVMIVEDAENGGTLIWVASVDRPALP